MEILFNHLDSLQIRAKEQNKKMLFGFSDDDIKTIETICEGINENKNRWPSIEINIYYTAKKKMKVELA